jgi:hypothetical protein
MELISAERRSELLYSEPAQEIRKLEFQDFYEVDRALFEQWRSGDSAGAIRTIEGFLESRTKRAANGFGYRRVRIISEPLSEYQRMAVEISRSDPGLRWLPRSQVSTLPMPGNDCLIRNDMVIFNVLDGNANRGEIQLFTDPESIKFCNDAFDLAWSLGTPNGEYAP